MLANSYLFDEGTTISSFAFLLEGSLGVGDAVFGGTLGVRWVRRKERSLLNKVCSDHLRVKLEEDRGSRQ